MPRVSAQVVLDDTEARNFADKRLLGLSDAFDARISPDGKITGKIEPNHVLLFLKCAQKSDGFCGIPNDRGATFNNLKGTENMADDETKGMLSKIMEAVSPKENPLQKAVDNLTAEVQKRDAQIDALTKEVTALKADKQALDNLRAEQEKTKKDAQWAQIKNLYKPGMFHKPEDEAARRAEFENDPVVFQLANVGNLQTAKPTPAQGASAVGNLGDPDAPVDVVALRGEYDPLTHTFKGMN
jgi:outer membrane murein-binding lipoprotein Lpp